MDSNASYPGVAHALQSFAQIRELYPLSEEKSNAIIQDGILFHMMEDFMAVAGLDVTDVCFVWGIDGNCFRSWRHVGAISFDDSRLLLRLAEVYACGYSVFQQRRTFNIWMKEPSLRLGGIPPLSLLCEESGFDEVKGALRQMKNFVL